MEVPAEEVGQYEKRRYRVVLWFDSDVRYASDYAEALARLWDDWPGITSQGSQFARLREDYEVLADPIRRSE